MVDINFGNCVWHSFELVFVVRWLMQKSSDKVNMNSYSSFYGVGFS